MSTPEAYTLRMQKMHYKMPEMFMLEEMKELESGWFRLIRSLLPHRKIWDHFLIRHLISRTDIHSFTVYQEP